MSEYLVDRSKFHRGEWDDEPDKLQWKDEKTGLTCLIVRNSMGALCGYVGVQKGHRFYEKDYNDVPANVHGGLTYSDHCDTDGAICHVPAPGEPDDIWWLGFDCSHWNDLNPSMRYCGGGIYRNIEYVKAECSNLAQQIAEPKP